MTFTKKDFEEQKSKIKELQEELERTDRLFLATLDKLGITEQDLEKIKIEDFPEEIVEAVKADQKKLEEKVAADRNSVDLSKTTRGKIGKGRKGTVKL